MSLFEIAMLVCFGASWPFSIWKSWRTGAVGSKSLVFLILVFLGYLAGIVHKMINSLDFVIIFYILNALMVLADMLLWLRNRARARRA